MKLFIWVPACGLLATGIIAIATAQFIPERYNPAAPIVFASTPRFNTQEIKLEAGKSSRYAFDVEASYGSYVGFSTESQATIQYRVFDPEGKEVVEGLNAFIERKSSTGNVYKTLLDFANNYYIGLEKHLWELELTSDMDATLIMTQGNVLAGQVSLSVFANPGMPEIGEPTVVYAKVGNFDASTVKLEVQSFRSGQKSGPVVPVNDEGVAPDEVAKDGTFTGRLPSNETGNFWVAAYLYRKTRAGMFARTQLKTETYTVYPKTIRVIDQPKLTLNYQPLYGIPESIDLEFDVEVFTAGKYRVGAGLAAPNQSGESQEDQNLIDGNPLNLPFYNVGVHRIKFNFGLGRKVNRWWMDGPANINFDVLDENGRLIEGFTSKTKASYSKDLLFPKLFEGYDGDRMVDLNGDGDPDAIEVKFSYTIHKAGNYVWGADIDIPKDAQTEGTDRGNGAGENKEGFLGIGRHQFTMNVPLEDIWFTRAKGKFDVSVGAVIPDSSAGSAPLQEDQAVFKTNFYDLSLGDIIPPRTIESLIQATKAAKTLRPADGFKTEVLSKIEEARAFGTQNKVDEAQGAMNTVGELITGSVGSKYFSERTIRNLALIYSGPQADYQRGKFK